MEKTLVSKYPATRWNDATPLGNGLLGASVYGCVYDERILINHESLFNWCDDKEIPDISKSLFEVRKLMDEGKYKEAESYYTKKLEELPSSFLYLRRIISRFPFIRSRKIPLRAKSQRI